MKTNRSLIILALLIVFGSIGLAAPLGTAFTYQGRLTDGTNPATGKYDLTFKLCDALDSGNVVGGPLTNAAIGFTNGLFMVALDFGAVFNGDERWLEIGVRTNGSGAFTPLTPRQALLPTPHAVRALSAGSVMASNISGIIRPSQLSSNVALLNGSPTFAGTVTASSFSGSGAGLTGLPGGMTAQVVSGTTVQAQSNTAYVLTNDALVTLTLPSSPNVGDFVRITSTGTNGWKLALNPGQSVRLRYLGTSPELDTWDGGAIPLNWAAVASSSDGAKLVAIVLGGQIYTSTDSGVIWTAQANAPAANWFSVASSSDGAKLVAVVIDGQIYTSTDSGVTWTAQTNAPSASWYSVASSSDGAKLVAAVSGGPIYTSTDSGVTWTIQTNAPSTGWYSVASSSDGAKLVAVIFNGQIYTSTNSGVTWTARESNRYWQSVASSADGNKLVAVVNYNGQIYTSTNSGVTWTARESNRYWQSVASSADGIKLVAIVGYGQIYTSADSGATWTAQTNAPSTGWYSVASSSDGIKLVAVAQGGQIYTSTDSGVTWSSTGPPSSFFGLQYSALELQYVGNGQFLPVSSSGAGSAFSLQ